MDFSVELEAISLIILVILGLFHYDSNNKHDRKYQWFNGCLVVSAIAIVSDLVTCSMLVDISAYPVQAHIFANSIYFIAINSSMSLTAAYVFYLMFAHMREQKCYKIATSIITAMYVLVIACVFVNPWTGWYFYFENNAYCRGPLNKLGFLVVIIEVLMLCMCYIRNRKIVTPYAGHLVRTLPPLVVVITIVQMLVPNTIFTGTMASIVNLIIFACFQNNRIGRDALTELPNRSSFFREWNYHKKKYKNSHVMLVHVRHMDQVNKRFGMKKGDSFLYKVARYLENLPVDYQVYRYGNTHFLLFGEFHTMDEANKLADEIFDRFTKPWEIQGEKWIQQLQLIHMRFPAEEMDENILTDYMNYLLEYSKSKTESTKVFLDDDLKAAYERKCYVLNEVKNALKKESFQLYFQPIYSCEKEKFVTAEVLLRLFTEDGVMISPGEFIPIADEKGLGDEISWFVMKNSMDFIKRYPDIPLESISINMSIQQIEDSYLEEKLKNNREQVMSMLNKIRVEITENAITQNLALVTKIMTALDSVGFKFYLDDFGMGYSNFSRVFALPFEVVKLDRSLITKIDEDERSFEIAKGMVKMLHSAGYKVLAEGVERETQVEKVKELGIERIQGYYYARPMNEAALIEFLKNN
jgi:EAL domain-containing protein (putative c-di-GMP-specific phosphodiesterase class I)/GGDEF domain-containing protein